MLQGEGMHNKKVKIFFWCFMFFYSFLICYKGNFGIIDDHTMHYLWNGEYLPLHIYPSSGRFFPLSGFEYNIIHFFSNSPFVFYLYNTIQFVIVILLLCKIFNRIKKNEKLIYAFVLILVLSSSFVVSWLKLFVSERNCIFFFMIFLYFYLKFQEKQKLSFLIICLISANISLYYKEPCFLMLGSFAFSHLFFGWRDINLKQKLFDVLLLVSSLIFVIVYYFVVYIYQGELLYGDGSFSLFYYVSIFVSYLLNDPLLFLNGVFFIWRCYCFIKKRLKFNLLYDSMSLAAIVYCLAFVKLLMFNFYYWLPAYAFALPALFFYFCEVNWKNKKILKFGSIVTLLLLVCSSLPSGIYFFSFYKNIPHNYQKTLTFLDSYIGEKFEKGDRTNLFLYGIYRISNDEIYNSFRLFLCEYKKLPPNSFDLKTDIESNKNVYVNEDLPYSFWNKEEVDEIVVGDLLVVTPYTYKNFYKELFEDYELIFRTDSPITIPDISLRSFIKYFVSGYIHKNSDNPGRYSNRFLGLPQDFFVFKKIR